MEKSLEAHLFECLSEGNTKKALYIVKLLGNEVNKLYRSKSPLSWAKEFENEDVVKALEEKSAVEEVIYDEEAVKLGGDLIDAIKQSGFRQNKLIKQSELRYVERLLATGANLDIKDADGYTALIWASCRGQLEMVEKLLDAGAIVNAKTEHGRTALLWASKYGHLEIVEKLIEAGANINIQDVEGSTALLLASEWGHLETVEKLIDAGANLDIQNKEGDTALMKAAAVGDLEIVEKLIEAGANVNMKNNEGQNAISLAANDGIRRAIINTVKRKYQNEPEKIVALGKDFEM